MHEPIKPKKIAAMLRTAFRAPLIATAPICLLAALATPSWAIEIETEVPDLKIRWDNTVGYSLGFRTDTPSARLTQGIGAAGFNDGDLNFSDRSKPISNRVDWFTEADVTYRNFGVRVSGAAWYDAVYNGGTSNTSGLATPGLFNQANTLDNGLPGQFPDATAKLHGNQAELLDAFVFGNFDLGETPVNVRLGRHALTWGETLFFGANGIAAGMSPVDLVKLQSSPNSTFKETTRPVNQLSAQAVVAPGVSVAAYYQLEYEKSRTSGSGSFFSALDSTDVGGARSFVAAGPTALALYNRLPNQEPSDDGQGGVSVNFGLPNTGVDIGLHAIQYTSKTPMTYAYFAGVANPTAHTFQMVYPEKIRAFAASFNTTAYDNVTIAGELGMRTNVPLTRALIILPSALKGVADANDNPFFPVGKTAHFNLSTTIAMPPNFLANEAIFTGEFAWNRVLSCDKMCTDIPPGALGGAFGITARDKKAERDAYGFRVLYVPTYRQVFSGVDVSVPMGLSYSPRGKSGAIGPMFVNHGGDMSIGVTATVRSAYSVSLRFTHYYGPEALPLNSAGAINFGQALKDRDNIMLSARYSF